MCEDLSELMTLPRIQCTIIPWATKVTASVGVIQPPIKSTSNIHVPMVYKSSDCLVTNSVIQDTTLDPTISIVLQVATMAHRTTRRRSGSSNNVIGSTSTQSQ